MNAFLIDILLLFMLSCSIVWSAIVHRRLKKIGFERTELASFIQQVESVVDKAEHAMMRLKMTAQEVAACVSREEGEAERHLHELSRLVAAATRVSQRLETSLTDAYRQLAAERSRGPASAAQHPAKGDIPVSAAVSGPAREAGDAMAMTGARDPGVEVSLPVETDAAPGPGSDLPLRPRHRSTVNSILDRLTRGSARLSEFEMASPS